MMRWMLWSLVFQLFLRAFAGANDAENGEKERKCKLWKLDGTYQAVGLGRCEPDDWDSSECTAFWDVNKDSVALCPMGLSEIVLSLPLSHFSFDVSCHN